MNLYQTILEVIDMRSFSNLWYWIALAVLWSTASHYVLGVPFDFAQRAAKDGDHKMQDLEVLVRINVGRILNIAEVSGLFMVGFACTALTTLFALGVFYGVEFAQAIFLMALPMSLVGLINIKTALKVRDEHPVGDALFFVLRRHRFIIQLIGMISIFITAMWGMFQNIVTGPLGG
ncbi:MULTISPECIES: component of SufBCD complex [Pacificibacter]|uniref:component of SufBCD complex n=1 Tax=Pacificibacter TaxID=1042323 RepID=UPI001C0958DA|nr:MULTISPECIES: component of SufBCD complex [Pacificibacter]MBU2935026.1 component of SufBCD complex [Pacificibacter marinus]MDO6617092.1 component of SufBCD complex [Pacificibacter sp. 1_MG-2023]